MHEFRPMRCRRMDTASVLKLSGLRVRWFRGLNFRFRVWGHGGGGSGFRGPQLLSGHGLNCVFLRKCVLCRYSIHPRAVEKQAVVGRQGLQSKRHYSCRQFQVFFLV